MVKHNVEERLLLDAYMIANAIKINKERPEGTPLIKINQDNLLYVIESLIKLIEEPEDKINVGYKPSIRVTHKEIGKAVEWELTKGRGWIECTGLETYDGFGDVMERYFEQTTEVK